MADFRKRKNSKSLLNSPYEELFKIEELADQLKDHADIKIENKVSFLGIDLPLYSFSFVQNPKNPTLVFVAGVHGLEKVGVQVALSFLESVASLLPWDDVIHRILENINLIFYPCANPIGVARSTRSNFNGVDLMRNGPIDSENNSVFFLPGGHRISSSLPWYRGQDGAPMEVESQTLCDFIMRVTESSPYSLILDIHSGFGSIDRLWFPFAYSRKPFPHLAEIQAFKKLLDLVIPYHIYSIEPQCMHYMAHGDLWDYMFLKRQTEKESSGLFLPLCLELGSWAWIRKNPRQLLNALGIFNPIKQHRLDRTLRRHLILFDFLLRSTLSYRKWALVGEEERRKLELEAFSQWYHRDVD